MTKERHRMIHGHVSSSAWLLNSSMNPSIWTAKQIKTKISSRQSNATCLLSTTVNNVIQHLKNIPCLITSKRMNENLHMVLAYGAYPLR